MTSCAESSSYVIDKQSFACYAESPNHVTFRARLHGRHVRERQWLIHLSDREVGECWCWYQCDWGTDDSGSKIFSCHLI